MLDVMVPPRGPLQSSEASLDLGCPQALSDGVFFPYDHDISVVVDDDVLLLDPSGPTLEEQTSLGQQ
jgi:hypothetical protein